MARREFNTERPRYVDGQAIVSGRCCDVEIRVGDEFTGLIWQALRRDPKWGWVPSAAEVAYPVSLRIEEIHAYERSIPVLYTGCTGALRLTGEGIERLELVPAQYRDGVWLLVGPGEAECSAADKTTTGTPLAGPSSHPSIPQPP